MTTVSAAAQTTIDEAVAYLTPATAAQITAAPAPPTPTAAPGAQTLTPYKDPLRILPTLRPRGDLAHLTIPARAGWHRLHSDLPATPIWGYAGAFPGPAIEVQRGQRLRVAWENRLAGPHPLLAVTTPDVTRLLLPGFDPAFGEKVDERVADLPPWLVVHLHGARTGAGSDGWAQNGVAVGAAQLSEYDNDQASCTLWYHDHAMNITALNVMAGLMSAYLIRDDEEAALDLPSGRYEIPLLICDRNLDTDASGQLTGRLLHKIVTDPAGMRLAPFFGPFTTVNGSIWPYLAVRPRWYRFRIVNGSNARTYTLALRYDDGTPVPATLANKAVWQIGSDAGLLPAPVNPPAAGLTLAPGERADVLVDFGVFRGRRVNWVNVNPVLPPPEPGVMQFRVAGQPPNGDFALPNKISRSFKRLTHDNIGPHEHRWVVLTPAKLTVMPEMWEMAEVDPATVTIPSDGIVQVTRPGGGVVTLKRVARMLEDTVNFIVKEGGWELWNVLSLGAPSHPFHIHLVRFQALQRVRYDASTFGKLPGGGFGTTVPVAPAGTASLDENEKGWKDTVRVGETANPTELSGELVTIAARFDGASGQYMYHCHILEHEDRSMMRPVLVLPASVIAMNPEMAHGHEH